jgi:hypothetical protein
MMAIFHELRIQQRELLDQMEELEEAIIELTTLLKNAVDDDQGEQDFDRHERLAWLHRQHAGVVVTLGETERSLLALDE